MALMGHQWAPTHLPNPLGREVRGRTGVKPLLPRSHWIDEWPPATVPLHRFLAPRESSFELLLRIYEPSRPSLRASRRVSLFHEHAHDHTRECLR